MTGPSSTPPGARREPLAAAVELKGSGVRYGGAVTTCHEHGKQLVAGHVSVVDVHRPMVLDYRSRAGYHLLFFAGHVHGGRIEPPPIPKAPRQRRRFRLPWPRRRSRPAAPTGANDGDRARA